MPGFPALLAAGMSLFGESPARVRGLLCVVGVLAVAATYLFTRLLAGHAAGLWAAAIAAVAPTQVMFSVLMLSETPFAVAVLISLICLCWAKDESLGSSSSNVIVPTAGTISSAATTSATIPQTAGTPAFIIRWILAGVAIAAATYVRPTWILIGPAVAGLLLILSPNRRQAAVQAAVLLTALAACMLPWTMRNYHITGRFVPTTLWVGPSLYDGLNPNADGRSDMRFVEDDGVYQRMSEYDADQYYRAAAKKFVMENPGTAAALSVAKLGRYWSPWPNAAGFDRVEFQIAFGTFSLTVFFAAVVGLRSRRWSIWQLALTLGPVLYFSAVHAVFVGSLRYRLPAEFPVYAVAGVGLQQIAQRLFTQRGEQS